MFARPNPLSLKIVAGLFMLTGLLAAIDVVVKLFHQHLDLNLMLLGLWIGPGLLRHNPTWRKWTLAFLWLGFFSSAVLFWRCFVRPWIYGSWAKPPAPPPCSPSCSAPAPCFCWFCGNTAS